jgi:glutaredoxin/glutathione-dependent peroxiredoxin
VLRADDLAAKGVDTVACIAVNDAFVMGAWGDAQGADGKVLMLADGNGEFTAEVGLELDGSGFGLGTRSQRYAAIIDDGVVIDIMVEAGPGLEVSSVESVLDKL